MKLPLVAICIPTRGLININIVNWLLSFKADSFDFVFLFVEGLPMPDCRIELVKKFLTTDADYLFFLDDDTIPPLDAIEKLLAHNVDMVTGITWGKRIDEDNKAMIGYLDPNTGVHRWSDQWVYPDFFEIDVCGLSCALIKREVIEKVPKPCFKWEWYLKTKGGGTTKVYQGEDIFFCMTVKKEDFKIWCDSSVQCQHLDIKTGKHYPSKEKWEYFDKKNAYGRSFNFDSKGTFNKKRVKEILENARLN